MADSSNSRSFRDQSTGRLTLLNSKKMLLLISFRDRRCGKREAFSNRRSREADWVWEVRGGLWETGSLGFPRVDLNFPCAIRAGAEAEPMSDSPDYIHKCNWILEETIQMAHDLQPLLSGFDHRNSTGRCTISRWMARALARRA